MNILTDFRNAVVIGLVCAFLETVLLMSFEPNWNAMLILQSDLFWFGCGVTVYYLRFKHSHILISILFTILLMLPWLVLFSIAPKKYDHIIPLLVASIIMGTIIGLLKRRFLQNAIPER